MSSLKDMLYKLIPALEINANESRRTNEIFKQALKAYGIKDTISHFRLRFHSVGMIGEPRARGVKEYINEQISYYLSQDTTPDVLRPTNAKVIVAAFAWEGLIYAFDDLDSMITYLWATDLNQASMVLSQPNRMLNNLERDFKPMHQSFEDMQSAGFFGIYKDTLYLKNTIDEFLV